jgi:hypothetical protein
MFYFVNISYAQQQTYTLETSTFRLLFNKYTIANNGYATGIRECRYLPNDTTFSMFDGWTTIANVDSSWSVPLSVAILDSAPGVKNLTIYFTGGKRIVMCVTSHTRFLEFELLNVQGNCGDIRLFGPIFCRLPQGVRPGTKYEFEPITYLGNGYYVCLIAANPNTVPATHWNDDSTVLVMTHSPRYLPTLPDSSYRNQRFAFFICRAEEVKDIFNEVENYFHYPYGSALKDKSENDIDYLFLMGLNGASAQNIIQLCRNTELWAVMLYQEVWAIDFWTSQDMPFKIRPGIKQFIDSLKSEGIIVGLHCYVHLVPRNGYYAVHYPSEVSHSIIDGVFRAIKWTGPLPELIAQDFVARALVLEPDWIYFDGDGYLYEDTTTMQIDTRLDPYLDGRMTRKIMHKLRLNNYNLRIFQDAGGTGGYHFKSRIGQIDYWDPHPITGRNPIQEMDFCASQVVYRNRGLFTYTDLGWFGREIHIPTPPYRRDARWDEWQHLAYTSLTYDIPMGIRTTYSDFMTDPLRDSIVPLLRETIRLRRGLNVNYHNWAHQIRKALLHTHPNPFKDKTTILFNLPVECSVTLKVYDVSGKEVSTLISRQLPSGSHAYNWNANSLANGIYFCRLFAAPIPDGYGEYITATNKIIILK